MQPDRHGEPVHESGAKPFLCLSPCSGKRGIIGQSRAPRKSARNFESRFPALGDEDADPTRRLAASKRNRRGLPMAPDDAVPDKPAEGDVARAVFERFTRRLIGLARSQLDVRLQYKVDPEDVVQSAYKSFFLRYGEGALATEGWDGLWGMLTVITLRKCAD